MAGSLILQNLTAKTMPAESTKITVLMITWPNNTGRDQNKNKSLGMDTKSDSPPSDVDKLQTEEPGI